MFCLKQFFKLRFLASLVGPAATLLHEMMFECPNLWVSSSLVGPGKGFACTSACV